MVHGGDLKRALEICSFHTRDPPVEYSSHSPRKKKYAFFVLINYHKKQGSLTPKWTEDYSDIAERAVRPSGSDEDYRELRSKDLVKS